MSHSSSKGRVSLLASCRGALLGVALLSGLINILYLSGSLYMMEVYDRVLPSRSIPTLVGLSAIILALFMFQGLFDMLRGRIFARVGAALDEDLSQRVFRCQVAAPLRGKAEGDGQQPLRDLDQIRTFLAGGGPSALFDLPWIPLYLFICFAFHPLLGWVTVGGASVLVAITVMTDVLTRKASKAAVQAAALRNGIGDGARRNAEVVHAMGMAGRLGLMWGKANAQYLGHQQQASDVSGGFGAFSKVMRMTLQSGVLGVGAYLVIHNEATGGIMIASSILVSRALAPVELSIANWKGFVAARQGWSRLRTVLEDDKSDERPLQLPAPTASLSVESAGSGAPGPALRGAGRVVRAQGRHGAGHHRPERLRQVLACPHARRRVAGLARQDPPRRRRARAMAAGRARSAHRLPAAGRRAVRRDGGAEHRPLHRRPEPGRRDQGGAWQPTSTT